MHYSRIVLLAAAMAASSLTPTSPAFTDEPVGVGVTVMEAGTSDTSEDSVQGIQESQETPSSRKSKGHRTSIVDEEECISQGPDAQKEEREGTSAPRETSLGRFTITGYCDCKRYSGDHSLTYSSAVPTPDHAISVDLNYFPLGTKLKIDGTVYMAEDRGSFVDGNILDIYYDSHREALAKGTYTAEVSLVQD